MAVEWRRCVDLSVILDKDVSLAPTLAAIRKAGVDPISICGFLWGSLPLLHVLVAEAGDRQIVEDAGFDVRSESEVLMLHDGPTLELAIRASKQLTDAGVHLDICYATPEGGVVVGVDDFHLAQSVMDLWSEI